MKKRGPPQKLKRFTGLFLLRVVKRKEIEILAAGHKVKKNQFKRRGAALYKWNIFFGDMLSNTGKTTHLVNTV
jgi:hypothetical protein